MSDTTIGTEVHDDSPDHSEPVLEVQGVTKTFGPLSVLRGVDMTLHRGEVLGLVGDNGAGKSTLVKIMSGLFSQDSDASSSRATRCTSDRSPTPPRTGSRPCTRTWPSSPSCPCT